MIDPRYDIRFLQDLSSRFSSKTVDRALNTAVARTSRKTATLISRDVRKTYAIKAGDISKRLKIQRVRRDATRALIYTGRGLPLSKFSPRQKTVRVTATSSRGKQFQTRRRGATLRIRKDKGRQLVPQGWYAKDHILRRADASDNKSEPRMQFGPSIPGMVSHKSVMDEAQAFVREDLPTEFGRQMAYYVGKESGEL